MTDSKTPEWEREAATVDLGPPGVHVHHVSYEIVADRISQSLLSAYERGRKEGIQEAAKVATAYRAEHTQMSVDALDLGRELDLATSTKAATVSASIAEAIRQLLEVKG